MVELQNGQVWSTTLKTSTTLNSTVSFNVLRENYIKKYASIFPRKVKATSLPEGWPQPDPSFARSDATPWGTFPSPQPLNTPCYSPPGLWTLADLAGSGLDSYWAQKVLSLITTVNCINQAIFVHFYEGRRSLPRH